MQPKQRNISLDLYRILCMFLITTIHFFTYSTLYATVSPHHYNFYIIQAISVLQRFSITGFVLISAYFLVETQNTTRKIISFWLQLIFFSITTLVFTAFFIPSAFSLKNILKSLFPVLSHHYWYPVCYLILLIFVPTINKLVRCFSQKELLRLIFLLGFFLTVFFHFNPFTDETVYIGHYSHSLIWFFFLYLIAAYLRLYGVKRWILSGPVIFLVCSVLMFAIFVATELSKKAGPSYAFLVTFFNRVNLQSYNSLLPLLISVSSFITFLHFKPTPPNWVSRTVSFLVPATFGIYLIQEHNALRAFLWQTADIARFAHSPWMLPGIILVFLLLWAAAMVLYLLYRLAHKLCIGKLENWLLRLTQRVAARFGSHCNI